MHAVLIIACWLLVVGLLAVPLGGYMARVFSGAPVRFARLLGPLERLIYRVGGIDPAAEMTAMRYTLALLVFGALGFALLFAILMLQHLLPLNPQGLGGLSAPLAFNVAVSFVTNTNWQSYGGESTLSAFSQMVGLAVQNFVSAATGIAVACALFRGLARRQSATVGNAWTDITRSILYVLLPLSLIFALFLASQGVVQSFGPYVSYHALQGAEGIIPQGPVASQVAIKMLGSNGGGFFNANAAHPFENPTPLSDFMQLVSILLLPAALVIMFGSMIGDRRQAWALLVAMMLVFVPLLALDIRVEHEPNPRFDAATVDQSAGNMEGKETRFGPDLSAAWAVATTATSNGSVNAMHDSFTPMGGMVPLLLIQFGEVIFGGVGSGIYGMLVFVILTVFIGGLMVGRTPEYLGKKLGPFEIKMASLAVLIPSFLLLAGTALAVSAAAGRGGVFNPQAQGFSEILYALASASQNNGSAFAGLDASSAFYNLLLGIIMVVGRYGLIVPVMGIAGALAAKNTTPVSSGTLPTHTPLFVVMLVGTILLIGVLTYVPALALGPVAEHMRLYHAEVLP